MALLRPFVALRPTRACAAAVSSVPYDVVDRTEAARLAEGNALSFLHVSRAEIDLPEGTDPYSEAVYAKACSNFEALIAKAPLVSEPEASLYFYRLTWKGRSQTGIFGTFSIDEYERGDIRRHEKTRAEKEDDRTRHVLALKAQTGPVFLTYRGLPAVAVLTQAGISGEPLFEFTAPDGVKHELWKAPDSTGLVQAFAAVPRLYIADGHHRAAAACRARAEMRNANPSHHGDEPYNFFLAAAFPAEELRVLPYHRILKTLNGLSAQEFLRKLQGVVRVEPGTAEPVPGTFSLDLGKHCYRLVPEPVACGNCVARLDVSRLQDLILAPILGILDPRTDERIDFVGGIRGTAELEARVASGDAAAAIAMAPTSIEDLLSVSDGNEIMPPKSTWFEPKLRDGLLCHSLV